MRLRAVGTDRLALALAQPQMIDDPGTEQKDEQRACHHRPAGAEGDVAEHVQKRAEHAEAGNRVGKFVQPVKHSVCPMPRLGRARPCRESAFRAHSQWFSSSSQAIPWRPYWPSSCGRSEKRKL